MLTAEKIIEILGLVPLEEEGGMVRATYASEERIGNGPAGTAIYYLLSGKAFSHLHRLSADEVYHHYLGDAVDLYYIDREGRLEHRVLGPDLLAGQLPQVVVPKGAWQGSCLAQGGSWALLGTTMSPGYRQENYVHADARQLLDEYPAYEEVIHRLTGQVLYG